MAQFPWPLIGDFSVTVFRPRRQNADHCDHVPEHAMLNLEILGLHVRASSAALAHADHGHGDETEVRNAARHVPIHIVDDHRTLLTHHEEQMASLLEVVELDGPHPATCV